MDRNNAQRHYSAGLSRKRITERNKISKKILEKGTCVIMIRIIGTFENQILVYLI